jgi:hypothetical protein
MMQRIKRHGSLRHIARSSFVFAGISAAVAMRRLIGKPLVPEWPYVFEVCNLFWRSQFNHAFALGDIIEARRYFDSLRTLANEVYPVDVQPSKSDEPNGDGAVLS